MLRPLARAAILCLIAVGLSGCLTPRAKVAPSAAVLQARKGAGTKSAACPAGDLATLSPTIATFPFDDAVVDDVGIRALKTAAAWLNCHPGVPVVIIATADIPVALASVSPLLELKNVFEMVPVFELVNPFLVPALVIVAAKV